MGDGCNVAMGGRGGIGWYFCMSMWHLSGYILTSHAIRKYDLAITLVFTCRLNNSAYFVLDVYCL